MIIHAVNIHTGGGKVLLDQLLQEETFGKIKILICDARYILPVNVDSQLQIHRVKPTLLSRWIAEFLLKKLSTMNPHHQVLCFGNLPPAFKLKAEVILYLQNALLLPKAIFYAQNLKTTLRLTYERIWLKVFLKNINVIWVQTASMKAGLSNIKIPVWVKPFCPQLPPVDFQTIKKYNFITVSGSAPHKRLKVLLEAWELLGVNAPKILIISDFLSEELQNLVAKIPEKNIEIKTNISRQEIFQCYQESKCLIVTSKLESFCLPLYEAQHFKLKILGPNEPYVNDFGPINGILNLHDKHELKRSLEAAFINCDI